MQTVLYYVFLFHTEKDLTGCDLVEQERKQEIGGAAIFSTDVTFPVAADLSLVLVSPWLRAGSPLLMEMGIIQTGFIFMISYHFKISSVFSLDTCVVSMGVTLQVLYVCCTNLHACYIICVPWVLLWPYISHL